MTTTGIDCRLRQQKAVPWADFEVAVTSPVSSQEIVSITREGTSMVYPKQLRHENAISVAAHETGIVVYIALRARKITQSIFSSASKMQFLDKHSATEPA